MQRGWRSSVCGRRWWVRLGTGLSLLLIVLLLLHWAAHSATEADSDLTDLIALIEATNRDSPVLNQHEFTLAADHIPIVMYVYNRPAYLKQVMAGLRRVRGIESTLLIVSHDGALPNMMQLISHEADFCQVKELIHPVSAHAPCSEAGCGIFRLKAHWWWLQQMVWQGPTVLQLTNSKWRLFIEEDHELAADAYTLMQQMVQLEVLNETSGVWGVGLAPMLDRTPPLRAEPTQMLDWHWGVQNQGYAFPNSTWLQLRAVSDEFWQFHDGWDITLLHLMQLKLLPRRVLLPRLPRLKNIGSEGATQDSALYEEFGFNKFPLSDGTPATTLHIGPHTLGKDPSELPEMGPYGERYDWDAVRPGQMNNNWEGNYGASMRELPRWSPGKPNDNPVVDTTLNRSIVGSIVILGVWLLLLR